MFLKLSNKLRHCRKMLLKKAKQTTQFDYESRPHQGDEYWTLNCRYLFPRNIAIIDYWSDSDIEILDSMSVFHRPGAHNSAVRIYKLKKLYLWKYVNMQQMILFIVLVHELMNYDILDSEFEFCIDFLSV